ncbi:hypothetical protein [Micromonospora aurantiaca (nom. illeg.)]|uniref:hypothetical protein n=1 Tax=Micromonospora aurantiaca (nom. illeg.) TaxID=47850 RepID=UPI001656ED0A|nr:hypothetical protein [Micromonospora aurantiaca]MBC9004941.1 hypothetical protein [Micromonospora aurantiaca]
MHDTRLYDRSRPHSVDPIVDVSDPQQWNPFAYNNNSGCHGSCGYDDWAKVRKRSQPKSGGKKPKPVKKPQKDKPAQRQDKKKESDSIVLAAKIAKVFDVASTVLGLLPGFICQPCAVLGMIAGILAGVLFFIAGKIGDAIKAFGGALLGMVLGEAGKLLSSKLLVKKFGGQFFDVAHSISNNVHRCRFIPSAVRVRSTRLSTPST